MGLVVSVSVSWRRCQTRAVVSTRRWDMDLAEVRWINGISFQPDRRILMIALIISSDQREDVPIVSQGASYMTSGGRRVSDAQF